MYKLLFLTWLGYSGNETHNMSFYPIIVYVYSYSLHNFKIDFDPDLICKIICHSVIIVCKLIPSFCRNVRGREIDRYSAQSMRSTCPISKFIKPWYISLYFFKFKISLIYHLGRNILTSPKIWDIHFPTYIWYSRDSK